MKVITSHSYEELSRKAADLIGAQILIKPDCVLGLATGSSPIGTYQCLIEDYKKGRLDFSKVTSINLDEYEGLAPDNDQSYRYFMQHNLFNHVNIRPGSTHVPNGLAGDIQQECARYEEVIAREGGMDLQLLGIGVNGHIGFNEPDSYFPAETHRVELTPSTIQANRRFFEKEEDVPRFALTMGIRAIMQAKRVVVIAYGSAKAPILKEILQGPITPNVPASILQLHPDVTFFTDDESMALLK